MEFYKFIKISGLEGARTGYFVPHLYRLGYRIGVKVFGLSYLKYRLMGHTIWWVDNKENLIRAIETMDKLKETRIFDYVISE